MDFQYEIQKIRTQAPGVVAVHGLVLTTTSGTIGTALIPGGGASIVKTPAKTGRYTITLAPPVTGPVPTPLANLTFMGGWASLLLTDDTIMTASKGVIPFFRRDDISNPAQVGASAKDGTIELQWALTADAAHTDTEVQDGAAFYFCVYIGTPDKT